jgi:hypothetical protein
MAGGSLIPRGVDPKVGNIKDILSSEFEIHDYPQNPNILRAI